MSRGGTTRLGDGTTPIVVSSDGTTSLGGGIAQTESSRRWYRLVLVLVSVLQAVVPPNTSGGTVSTRRTQDEIFLGSKFEST